ncbi:MAG: helix-turn-helix domain-containing protein [Candidatus Dormibacteraeota bacterium]|nr:helix-turn-helix domain-containing protein [Candidatus Dormibacteraeota bacterium]
MGEPAIQAVSRAVQLLSFFTEEEPELTLAELASRFELGKTTTHRYATSLRREGLLRYDPRTGRYSLGIRLARLGRVAVAGLHVVDLAGPHLEAIARELNDTAVLAIWDGALPVVVRVAYPPRRGIFVGVREGDRLTSGTAQSLVMQAWLHPERTSDPELVQVRRQGYAVVTYEENGVTAVARPVFQEDAIVATVAVVGTVRTVDGTTVARVADRLGRVAADIGTELGGGRLPRGFTALR